MSESLAEEIDFSPDKNVLDEKPPKKVKKNEKETEKSWFLKILINNIMSNLRSAFIMGLVVMVYAAFNNDVPKTSNPPQANKFFSNLTNSPIKDHFKGEISKIFSTTKISSTKDISFVMFYAPWDRKSQEVRKEFEIVAQFMKEMIDLEAVNCWQPEGECQKRYSKVYGWPIFVVYLNDNRGLPYNGPLKADYMIKFLNSVVSPIERIKNGIDFLTFRTKYDVVILANLDVMVDLNRRNVDYEIFYSTALRFLEKDPFREVGFGIKTEKPGFKKKLTIYTSNETFSYFEPNWTTNGLITWLSEKIHKLTSWASPHGQKSTLLSKYLQPGPALILFTPRMILYETNYYYLLIREIALELFNCKNDFDNYSLRFALNKKRLNRNSNKSLMDFDEDFHKVLIKTPQNNTISTTFEFYTNNSICYSDLIKNQNQFGFYLDNNVLIENNINTFYNDRLKCEQDQKNYFKTSLLPDNFDKNSPINLQKRFLNNKNELKAFAESFYSIKIEKYEPKMFTSGLKSLKKFLKGFLCNSNRTLNLIAMDSLNYDGFTTNLNVNLLKNDQKTSAIIIDDQNESFFVLKSPINDVNLRKFIKRFFENSLNRSKSFTTNIPPTSKEFFITDLNAESFFNFTKQKKAVIIFFYTKHCAFCSGISYKLLKVAKMLENVEHLTFGRIDGDLNTLPWEFTMEKLPTLLFFPDEKKSETRVFPKSTPITVSTLINFILTNLSPTLKVHAMWSICMKIKFEADQNKCILSIRLETLSLIERTLQEWRKAQSELKSYIVDKLSALRRLHLILGQKTKDNSQSIQTLFVKLTKQ
nr:thioredoxin domain-containing protein 11 [Onthophagus taurus]XP_022917658.1 thioredoxin domain-containing protein 11 [Onthophagus taurus]